MHIARQVYCEQMASRTDWKALALIAGIFAIGTGFRIASFVENSSVTTGAGVAVGVAVVGTLSLYARRIRHGSATCRR